MAHSTWPAVVLVSVLAGCAPAATVAPTIGPTTSATQSSVPAPSGSSASATSRPPFPTPTFALSSLAPVPEPSIVPAGPPFDVSWSPLGGRGAPSIEGSLSEPFAWGRPSAVRFGSGAVVAYSTGSAGGALRGPMIWSSPDLEHWERAVPADLDGPWVEARQVVLGGPGVAVFALEVDDDQVEHAARLWLTADGTVWEEGSIPDDARFLWGRPGRLVAFGRTTWVSNDGNAWFDAGPSPLNTAERLMPWSATIIDDGGSGLVFLRLSADSVTTAYRLSASGEWLKLGDLPGVVLGAVRGRTGIVAVGWLHAGPSATWASIDGRTWQQGLDAVGDILAATPTGYVAVGGRSYYEGCSGADPYQQIAQTWTSPDGLTWQQMPEDVRLDHVDLRILFPEGNRLIAIGLRWAKSTEANELDDRSSPSAWASQPFQPVPSHAPLPTAHGCSEG